MDAPPQRTRPCDPEPLPSRGLVSGIRAAIFGVGDPACWVYARDPAWRCSYQYPPRRRRGQRGWCYLPPRTRAVRLHGRGRPREVGAGGRHRLRARAVLSTGQPARSFSPARPACCRHESQMFLGKSCTRFTELLRRIEPSRARSSARQGPRRASAFAIATWWSDAAGDPDVIVLGAGVAGLSAAVRWRTLALACW